MNNYRFTYEVSVYDGLGYHLRDKEMTCIIEAVSLEQAKTVFKANYDTDILNIEPIEESNG